MCHSAYLQQRTMRETTRYSTNLKNMETTIKVSNREIAIRAFDHLRHKKKTDSALRLAHHLLHYDRISLGIGEVDWEIDMAIQKFGGSPRTGYRYTAHFSFKGETEMEKERYEEIFNGKE